MTRNEKQDNIVKEWFLQCKGTLKAYTGFGKTRLTCNIINEIRKVTDKRIIIHVDRIALLNQWKEVLKLYTANENIDILTIQYCIENNIRFNDIALYIVDEIHNFYSEQRLPYLQGKYINYKTNLGLSATPNDEVIRDKKDREIINQLNDWKIFSEVTREEGLANNWTNQVDEYVLLVDFTEDLQKEYERHDKNVRTLFGKYCKNSNLTFFNTRTSAKPPVNSHDFSTEYRGVKYNYIYRNAEKEQIYSTNSTLIDLAYDNGWTPEIWHKGIKGRIGYNPLSEHKNTQFNPYMMYTQVRKLKESLSKRLEMIWGADIKIKTVLELYTILSDKKIVIFNQRIEVANKIAEGLIALDVNCGIYHSKISKKKNAATLQKFKDNEIRVLSSVTSTNTGLDVPDLEVAISVAGVKNPNTYMQSVGRIRSRGIAITLCMRNTKEEEDIVKRTKNSKTEWINMEQLVEILT